MEMDESSGDIIITYDLGYVKSVSIFTCNASQTCQVLYRIIRLRSDLPLNVNTRVSGVGRIHSDISSNILKKVCHIVMENFVNLLLIS